MSANGDDGDELNDVNGDYSEDATAHQSAYIFALSGNEDAHERPTKRRKVVRGSDKADKLDQHTFLPIASGAEPANLAAARQRAFRNICTQQEKIINVVLDRFDTTTVDAIDSFVRDTDSEVSNGKTPAALIVTGTGGSAQLKAFERLNSGWAKDNIHLLQISSSQASNLKTALKAIIRGVVVQVDGVDGYLSYFNEHKKAIPLNYDLELLYQFIKDRDLSRVVLSFSDSEAFEAHLIAELLYIFSAWNDRIPFVLLFQVATSVDLFEARLSSAAVRTLHGRRFYLESHNEAFQETLERLCMADNTQVFFGADATRALLEQSKEQLATPESTALSFKYGLMTHMFADPLNSLLDRSAPLQETEVNYLCEIVRNTSSFRLYAESKLGARDVNTAKKLLNDNTFLVQESMKAIGRGQIAMRDFCSGVYDFHRLLTKVQPSKALSFADVYITAMSGDFTQTPMFRDLMLSIKKLASDSLLDLFLGFVEPLGFFLEEEALLIQNDLTNLASTPAWPIRSKHDTTTTTTSTTTITSNNRISLTSTPKKPTAAETKYTTLLNRYLKFLSSHFSASIISPRSLFLSEVFIYSGKLPLSTAFTPRPRFAIERALTSPVDYLGCECCADIRDDEVRRCQPPMAVLWRLWCEAGSLVNVRDLWSAFWNVVGKSSRDGEVDDGEEEEKEEEEEGEEGDKGMDERQALAIFYLSLAELRMLGFVKSTKKKVDCVAKASWKGL